jgi:GDPmannose 4,6-dehydratase
VILDKKLIRPAEVDTLLANPNKAKKILKWKQKISFDDLVKNMVDHDLEHVSDSDLF